MASKGQKFKKHDNKIKEEIICKLQSGTSSVNDTIRMYKKRNITMYKIVHIINLKKYILFCYTLF